MEALNRRCEVFIKVCAVERERLRGGKDGVAHLTREVETCPKRYWSLAEERAAPRAR